MRQQCHWLLAVVVTLVFLGAEMVMAAAPVATVQAASGTVTVKRKGVTALTPLAVRSSLNVGDVVGTGADGKATLLFSDGSQTHLNANSAIEITAPSSVGKGKQSLFRALSGEVWARLQPGKAAQTRAVNAGVRGTEFHLKVADDGTTTVTVLEGEVDFFNPHGAVVVGESQQSVARPNAAPTAPVTVPNAGLMIEWTLDLDRALIPREKFFITPERKALEGELQQRSGRVRLQPNDPDAHRDYGDALFDSGKFEDALKEYQEANRLAPNQPVTLTRLGDALLELGRVDEAEGSYRATLSPRVAFNPSRDGNGAVFPLTYVRGSDYVGGVPSHTPALIGLAWTALMRNRPAEAQKMAEQTLAVATVGQEFPFRLVGQTTWAEKDFSPYGSEAHIALGLSLMRQPGKLDEAARAFQAALNEEPKAYHYQARAWLAMVYLAQNNSADALKEGQAAAQLMPQSALAHGNLSVVYFFNGKPLDAEREARMATKLNPDSVAARCVLGQALLARGDVDRAAQTAAQAVALDPQLPQARYLAGIAEGQRRNYRHATRELKETLTQAPDFMPAASGLARVYTRMGRNQEAVTLLNDILPRHPQSDEVVAALGVVYYEQGKYKEAVEQYQKALQLKPNSALYHAELARTLIDANHLNEAIIAGQQAVRLAPDVGQFHAILGLAYDFSRLNVQAEREYRTALALDPRNALAHLELGLKAAQSDVRENRFIPKSGVQSPEDLMKQGLQAVSSSPAVSSLTQAFLYDPAISRQVLRGGVRTDLTLNGGNTSPLNSSLTHRSLGIGGAFHSLGGAVRERDDGIRDNDHSKQSGYAENLTFLPDPRTTLFARFSRRRTEQGVPGTVSLPDPDNRSETRDTLYQFAAQRRMSSRSYLWLGLSRPTAQFNLIDPGRNNSFLLALPQQGSGIVIFGTPRQEIESHSVVPELRMEFALNREPTRPTVLTLGVTHANLHATAMTNIFFPTTPPVDTIAETRVDRRLSVAYAQLTERVNDRLSFVAQLRRQRFESTGTTALWGGTAVVGTAPLASVSESDVLPSLLVNYRANERTFLRLFANRQAQGQEFTTFAFRPTETLLSVEPLVMPKGSLKNSRTVELEAERYLGARGFLKLFAFHTTAEGVDLAGLPLMESVEREGWGVRYEQQLSRNLYGQAGFLINRTTNRTPFAPYDEGTAPYHAPRLAGLALNYVDRAGTKVGLQLNYVGKFFQDTSDFSIAARPVFPAKTYVDLTIAKEPSLRYEFFIKVLNLFDNPAVLFNDIPTSKRRVVGGATVRS